MKYFERLSFGRSVYLPVHLHQSISSLKKGRKKHLSVCLISFNLSACQLMCHFKDLSSSMLICLSACVCPSACQLQCAFETLKAKSLFSPFIPPKPKYYNIIQYNIPALSLITFTISSQLFPPNVPLPTSVAVSQL